MSWHETVRDFSHDETIAHLEEQADIWIERERGN